MNTFEKLKRELAPYKNTLVIDDNYKVTRLVDIVDGGEDYYWVVDDMKRLIHQSCVGGWIPLKGFIREEEYNRLVRRWNLNNVEKVH